MVILNGKAVIARIEALLNENALLRGEVREAVSNAKRCAKKIDELTVEVKALSEKIALIEEPPANNRTDRTDAEQLHDWLYGVEK